MVAIEGVSDLGAIQSENIRKNANLSTLSIIGEDSDLADVYNIEGNIRTITIDGIFVGIKAMQASFRAELDAIMPEEQVVPIGYSSDVQGGIKVKVDSFDITTEAGIPTLLFYTIKMIESA